MNIVRGIISPHPPIIIPEVGKEEVAKVTNTINALEKVAKEICALQPETVIFITPHGTVFQDAVAVTTVPHLTGNFAQFGAGYVSFSYNNDILLVKEILSTAAEKGISIASLDENLASRFGTSVKLDHGVTVPLYFLKKYGLSCTIIPISLGFLPFEELYQFGNAIREAADKIGRRVVIVASGDLSHRLIPDAPAGYHPRGKEFDLLLVDLFKKWDIEGIMGLDRTLIDCAGECGLRSFIIMLGAFDGFKIETNVLSYEGPFGVGYLVADFIPGSYSAERELIEKIFSMRQENLKIIRDKESEPVALARRTLETYINKGQVIESLPGMKELLNKRAGVFVSIKKHDQLRGCIGTIQPTQANVAGEIIQNAISAGTQDPRFEPVAQGELNDLTYSVDILNPPEPISGMEELDPKRYGVIVKSGRKSGLLLPNLEGINTPEEQVEIAKQKAGIRQGEPVKLERFEVVRYH